MSLSFSSVPPLQVDLVWPHVAPLAEKGLKQIRDDSLDVADMRERLLDGRFLLWVAHDAEKIIGALVLNVVERKQGPVLFVVMVAGRRFQEWAPKAQALLQDYMDLIGARKIESYSRVGMEKWMRELGWKKRAVIMEWTNGR